MEITLIPKQRMVLMRVSGEIDHHTSGIIKQTIEKEIMRSGAINIAFDFGRVSFMDSSGIAVVINALRQMTRIKGKLYVAGLRTQPMRVFRASGVDKLVEMKEVVS